MGQKYKGRVGICDGTGLSWTVSGLGQNLEVLYHSGLAELLITTQS